MICSLFFLPEEINKTQLSLSRHALGVVDGFLTDFSDVIKVW